MVSFHAKAATSPKAEMIRALRDSKNWILNGFSFAISDESVAVYIWDSQTEKS